MPYKNPADARAAWRAYYARTPKLKEASMARKKALQERNRQYVQKLKDNPCVDCGGRFPYYVMDFDHLPEHKKVREITKLVYSASSIARIQEEIDKCELVCANCHRVRTYERGEWDSFPQPGVAPVAGAEDVNLGVEFDPPLHPSEQVPSDTPLD